MPLTKEEAEKTYDCWQQGDTLPNFPQMNVVGNNDLCPNKGEMSGKINPDSFEYFYTYQYEKTTETANLQKYNGEYMKSVYSYDYGCAHFVVINSNNYIEEQKALVCDILIVLHSF